MPKKTVILSLLAGVVAGGVASLISAQIVENTSTPQFCSSCHEMKPMYTTWLKGPHGPLGNDARVIRARCVDCHLPHDNVVSYLIAKGSSGFKDFMGHVFKGGYEGRPDYWLEKLKERNHYVYVNSCRHCHEHLPDNRSHRAIKEGKVEGSCLRCHWYVGHGEVLASEIEKFF